MHNPVVKRLWQQPPPQALRFLQGRGAAGDEPQGTMGRVQTAVEALCLLPAFFCAHIFIDRETSGYEAAVAISRLEFQEKIYLTSLVDPYCIETVRLYKV